MPERYELIGEGASISGKSWITASELWSFTLVLAEPAFNRNTIDWSKNLPNNDVTGWLEIDLERKRLIIRPGKAVPDEPWQ